MEEDKIQHQKIIFLDIDGVLATTREFNRNRVKFRKKNPIASELGLDYPFNKRCVEILNDILNKTDAEIILSSDWRHFWGPCDLKIIFEFNGVIKSPRGGTQRLKSGFRSSLEEDRHFEIMTWLKNNPTERWCAVDDLNMANLFAESGFGDRFIHTREKEGLKQLSVAEKIIRTLSGH